MNQRRKSIAVPSSRAPAGRLRTAAFTLIEISIVLVIIGLIVGGVLVGQDLIRAAEVRATISQIEKYNTAVNTFRDKYGGLPGDLNGASAAQFGFAARGSLQGQGDGNGVLESNTGGTVLGAIQNVGETVTFWVDLSQAGLIDGGFSNAAETYVPYALTTTTAIATFLPQAKLGNGNFVYVFSGGGCCGGGWTPTGQNYFGIAGIFTLTGPGWPESNLDISVRTAYAIDKKMDDGFPQTGNVLAAIVDGRDVNQFPTLVGTSDTSATLGSSTTCFDNGNVGGATQQYSTEQNGGAGMNCALSFRFQ